MHVGPDALTLGAQQILGEYMTAGTNTCMEQFSFATGNPAKVGFLTIP